MLVLGIHGGFTLENEPDPLGHMFHDASAAILRDGQVIAAVEEERLNRIKHTNCFPMRAIQFCLESSGCTLNDVDLIAINRSEHISDLIERERYLEDPTCMQAPSARVRFATLFEKAFGAEVTSKLRFCQHHLAHAWSASSLSGFESSLILSVDGDGDNSSGAVLRADGTKLTKLRELSILQSLGHLYTSLIKMVGYGRFDEYKAMGLAPYGDPAVYAKTFSKCFTLLPQGDYLLQDAYAWFAAIADAGLIESARRKGEPFTQVHKDLAASFQQILESVVLHVLHHFRQTTGLQSLCMVGGVAQNSSLNGKIAYSSLFKDIFVQPASHDAGGALGAALWAHCAASQLPIQKGLPHVYFGPALGGNELIERRIASWSSFVTAKRYDRICLRAAELLADGHVLGWMQGRSEFGPRALGNRSILADPRPSQNKQRINRMIKMRESYRPFAPSILEERLADHYCVPGDMTSFPFMAVVLKTADTSKDILGAVTHVDGTARVQTVSRTWNPLYWTLISDFEKLTGVPVLLNTSFNNNAEPIVDSVDDAINCYLTSGLDFLVVGDWVISKRPEADIDAACTLSYPILGVARKLACTKHSAPSTPCSAAFHIESVKSKDFLPGTTPISEVMFGVLASADGEHTLKDLVGGAGHRETSLDAHIIRELRDLWAGRLLALSPEPQRPPRAVL